MIERPRWAAQPARREAGRRGVARLAPLLAVDRAASSALSRSSIASDSPPSPLRLLPATAEGAVRLRNGNPGMVIASGVEYGEECWASYEGKPLAVGIYKAGELHPSRVFNL